MYFFGESDTNVDEVQHLKDEIKRLKEVKSLNADDKLFELWMRFMSNQQQYQDIMKEMAQIYASRIS